MQASNLIQDVLSVSPMAHAGLAHAVTLHEVLPRWPVRLRMTQCARFLA